MENNQSSSTGVVVGVLVVAVIAIVAFLGYKQGFFSGKSSEPTPNSLQINVGGESNTPAQ